MTIDWTSFAYGLVVGAVVVFLLRMFALRSLNLKLEQLGIALGVEGFEPKQPGMKGDVKIRDISGRTGDIGGTMNKDVHIGTPDTSLEPSAQPVHSGSAMPRNATAEGKVAIRDISGSTGDIAGVMDKSVRYGPHKTLADQINQFTTASGKYEQQSRLYTYDYRGDVPRIHQDISRAIEDGWFVTNATTLTDYEGRMAVWVILSRQVQAKADSRLEFLDIRQQNT
jgi:hypothetical protein